MGRDPALHLDVRQADDRGDRQLLPWRFDGHVQRHGLSRLAEDAIHDHLRALHPNGKVGRRVEDNGSEERDRIVNRLFQEVVGARLLPTYQLIVDLLRDEDRRLAEAAVRTAPLPSL